MQYLDPLNVFIVQTFNGFNFMKRRMQFFLAAAVLLLATSCAESYNLEGSSWSMESINGVVMGEDVVVEDDSFTLNFGADNALSGKGVCNRLIGHYEVLEGGKLSIKGVGATLMFCPNLELESSFVSALESASSYEVKGETLTLYSNQGEVMTFVINQ